MLTPTELVIVELISGGSDLVARLHRGEPVADVLGPLSAFQQGEKRISIDHLQSANWTSADPSTACCNSATSGLPERRGMKIDEYIAPRDHS
jgi:hypothetical protein